jgi:cation diffusion facilitator family transporter
MFSLEVSILETYEKIKESEKGAWVSIFAYIVLSLLKTAIGYWSGSEALTADGFNNATDIILSLAILVGLKISRKPPDQDHTYGHFRAESISALVASFIMITVSLQVMVQAGRTLIAQTYDTPDIWASWTALVSAAVMYAVYSYNKKLAAKSGSESLMAAAKDNLSDAMVSLGVVVGVAGSHLGLPWLDPVAALVVGVMIAKTAVEIFKSSAYNLTDGFDENELDSFRQTAAATPGVLNIKDIKARFLGSNVMVDMVILVDPQLSVAQSHDISDEIERRMLEEHRIFNAHVHIEPLHEEDEEHCYV